MLLPELGIGYSPRRRSVTFPVQACAKYGKFREIYVPSGALDAVENLLLLERPEVVASSAKSLARQRHDLFVVDHIDTRRRHTAGRPGRAAAHVHDVGDDATDTANHRARERRRVVVAGFSSIASSIIIFVGSSYFMANGSALTCAIAGCLTQCPHRFVSLACPSLRKRTASGQVSVSAITRQATAQ